MITWLRRQPNNNHRDSLFNLPLYPPPKKSGGIDLASQQITADVNEILVDYSINKERGAVLENE